MTKDLLGQFIIGIVFGLILAFLLTFNNEPIILNALLITIWIGMLLSTIMGIIKAYGPEHRN